MHDVGFVTNFQMIMSASLAQKKSCKKTKVCIVATDNLIVAVSLSAIDMKP